MFDQKLHVIKCTPSRTYVTTEENARSRQILFLGNQRCRDILLEKEHFKES